MPEYKKRGNTIMKKTLFILAEADDQNVKTIPYTKRVDAEKEMIRRFLDTVTIEEEDDKKELLARLNSDATDSILEGINIVNGCFIPSVNDYYGVNKHGAWWCNESSGMQWAVNEIKMPMEAVARALIRQMRTYRCTDDEIANALLEECDWDYDKSFAFIASFDREIAEA